MRLCLCFMRLCVYVLINQCDNVLIPKTDPKYIKSGACNVCNVCNVIGRHKIVLFNGQP